MFARMIENAISAEKKAGIKVLWVSYVVHLGNYEQFHEGNTVQSEKYWDMRLGYWHSM